MKKNLIAVAVLSASVISCGAFASDGKVNFTGSITDVSCTIDTNSVNQTVDLGKVSKTAFSGAGSTAAAKKFTLVLKTCPATVTSAKVRFDGTQVPGDNSVLALTADSGNEAKAVGIQLSDDQNNVIKLYEDSSAYTLTTADNNLNFTARYYATGAVDVGSANAVANFTIIYP